MNTLTQLRLAVPCALVALTFPADAISPNDIQPEKELLITHPAVVDSKLAEYPGPWSFGTLMSELAGQTGGSEFVKDWLLSMSAMTFVPDAPGPKLGAKPRPNFVKLIVEPWQRRDGHDPKSGGDWVPKLENAPFRLLAIVNRIDLGAPSFVDFANDERLKWRHFGKEELFDMLLASSKDGVPLNLQPKPSNFAFPKPQPAGGGWGGGGGGAVTAAGIGEGRFVFGAVDDAGLPLAGGWTVIFEYNLSRDTGRQGNIVNATTTKRRGESDQRPAFAFAWASRWHALADLDLTDHRFVTELESITKIFTHRGAGTAPTLAQLRSNDGALGPGREFRQYRLNNGKLELQLLPGTPAPEFMKKGSNEARALAGFLREQTPLIRAGIGGLPSSLRDGNKTLQVSTAVALIPQEDPYFHWDLSAPRESRRLFSLMTCNGCHAGETATRNGMHIEPRSVGQSSTLSPWLAAGRTGLRIDDPGFNNTRVDLREMQDRREILAAFLTPRESKRLQQLRETLRDRLSRTH